MTDDKLKSYVDRLENLDAEQKGIGTDKRDVFDEAAGAGYDKKALRRLLRDRKEAAKDNGTAELADQYRTLLSEPGATYRSVAEKTGGKRSTIQRLVPRENHGTDVSRSLECGTSDSTEPVEPKGNSGCPGERGTAPATAATALAVWGSVPAVQIAAKGPLGAVAASEPRVATLNPDEDKLEFLPFLRRGLR